MNQLYAMHYGTVPVVHEVGGLRDTVRHYDGTNDGTGWKSSAPRRTSSSGVLGQAVYQFRAPRRLRADRRRGMQQDLGWDQAGYLYEQKLLEAKYAH